MMKMRMAMVIIVVMTLIWFSADHRPPTSNQPSDISCHFQITHDFTQRTWIEFKISLPKVKKFFLLTYTFWVDSSYRGIGRNRIWFGTKFSMILLLFICSSAWMEAAATINICLLFFCPHSVIAQVLEVLEGSSRLSQPWTTVTWRQFLSFHLNSTKVFVLVFTSCCSSSA